MTNETTYAETGSYRSAYSRGSNLAGWRSNSGTGASFLFLELLGNSEVSCPGHGNISSVELALSGISYSIARICVG